MKNLAASMWTILALLIGLFALASNANAQLPTAMTQEQIHSLNDQKLKTYHQWLLDETNRMAALQRTYESQWNSAKQSGGDFPNLPGTAADCAAGRHWELVPNARCVCDGDPIHKAVSNDNPAACVGVPAPPTGPEIVTTWENQTMPCPAPQTGTMWQTRQVVTTNGIPAYGAWIPNGDTCAGPVAPSPAVPVITVVPETQTVMCPLGYSGSGVVQTRQVTYTDGIVSSYGPWSVATADCRIVPEPIPAQPTEPMVPVSVTICGGAYGYITAVVPQSQVDAWYVQYSNWYVLREIFLNNGSGFDGSCGVGL